MGNIKKAKAASLKLALQNIRIMLERARREINEERKDDLILKALMEAVEALK